jgi:c-di-GMP-binding flagellar brake protein YcgR
MENQEPEVPSPSRRRHVRLPYVREAVPVRVHQGDDATTDHLMVTRDLSAGGIGLAFQRALPAGTRLELTLRRLDGVEMPLTGVVSHCSSLGGGESIIGVKLDQLINPLDYVEPS